MLTRSCSCEHLKEIWYGDRIPIRITVPRARLHLMKAESRAQSADPADGDGR